MSDTYDAFDPHYLEDSQRRQAASSIVNSAEDDPEKTARAIQLGDATGVDSTLIKPNLENFEQQHKVSVNNRLVQDNEFLRTYLNSHPLAASLSHDDLGNLDQLSETSQKYSSDSTLQQWLKTETDIGKSFKEGFGEQPFGRMLFPPERPNDVEWALSHPLAASVAGVPFMPIEALTRVTGGLLRAGHDVMQSMFGEKFANEMAGMAEYGMTRGDIGVKGGGGVVHPNTVLMTKMQEVARALEIADHYTAADKEPAIGIHPIIDDAKKLQVKDDLDELTDMLKDANSTETKERSPEFLARFNRIVMGDRQIGIEGEAALRLYGDKPPTSDDGLLGFVPGIEQQLASARLTGEDIRIPAADWLAHVDPEVAKTLHDDTRPRDGGYTLNETKVGSDIEKPPETIRAAAYRLEQTGEIFEGQLHNDAADAYTRKYPDVEMGTHDLEDGFVTSKGKFVDREEALKIADKADQIKDELKENVKEGDIKDLAAEHLAPAKALHPIPEPKEVIADPLTIIRGGAGLEPMFQVGDRNIRLEKKPTNIDEKTGVVGGDQFSLHDETGKDIGRLKATPLDGGKRLYIDNVSANVALNFGPNSFGPSLTRSLIGQLKQAYPNVEEIGGFRISGARGKAGTERDVWIKVQPGDYDPYDRETHFAFRKLLSQNWEEAGEGVSALFSSEGKGLAANSLMGQMVLSELRRIAPGIESDVAHGVHSGVAGEVQGVFIPNLRQILVSLRSKDPIGTARHEATHGIWDLLEDRERATLEKAVVDEGWRDKYDIDHRWRNFPGVDLPQEAVAEAFRHWSGGAKMSPEVHTVFEKIKAFFEGLRQRLGEMLGHDLTWEQIFEKIDSGEIGSREPKPEAQRLEDELSGMLGKSKALPEDEPSDLYDRGKALGVTQAHMNRMQKLIDQETKNTIANRQRRAEVRNRRALNVEYKERRTQLRDEVRETLGGRPDIATDALFSKGKIKIDPATLSEDQRARLPKDYIQKKDGINPDHLAPYFGYTSGDALVERLALITEDRKRSGMSQRDYFNRLVDVETDRRLNAEFQGRETNALDEAKDEALSEPSLNRIHEETMAYALKAGQEPQFNRAEVVAAVKNDFDSRPVGSISSDSLLQRAGAILMKVNEAGAKGKWIEAYRLMQQRNHTAIAAKLARDFEKTKRQFDRTAKTFSKNRTFSGIDQEYVNWIQDLLLRTGHRLGRSVQDLQENIARQSETTLGDFIDAKEAEFKGMRQLDVPDFLRDPDFRTKVDDLSVHDFEGLRQGVKILEKAGRDEKTVNVEGEAYDRAAVKSKMRSQLETFGYSTAKLVGSNSAVVTALRYTAYGLTNMETLLNRWDRGDRLGMFHKVVIHPLVEAANGKAKLLREVADDLSKLSRPGKEELRKLVDAPFPRPSSPDGQGTWTGFNKGNVLMMLQNAGNKSNWNVLARGYGADPEALFKWLQKNITREDVVRAQGLGNIFKKLVAKSDRLYERLTGATVEKIPLEPIKFQFADGTEIESPGWYHPLTRSASEASMWKEDKETGTQVRTGARSRESAYDDSDYFHASTSNGYTKKRTGAIYPLELDYNMVPSRLRQMAHDINFREPILNVEKIFGDRLFKEDVAKYYGKEYADGLMPYLKRLAGSEGIQSGAMAWADKFIGSSVQNIVSTYIGYNPFTVLKHGPTAWVLSMREVGSKEFLQSALELAKPDGKSIREFARNNSEELQRRERHWQDTLGGQSQELASEGTIRDRIIENGSKWVAKSDMMSAMPTWWAAYKDARAKGESHGTSVTLADTAVRNAHGSTAETNLPPAATMGGINRYMTAVYGFFGTVMQRRIEIAHQANDIFKLGREGEIKEAAKNVPKLLQDFMVYVVWPTAIEEAVTGITTEDKRGWGAHLLSGATMGIASGMLYARDLVYGLTTGHDPGAGLISSAFHDVANVARDIRKGTGAFDKQHAGKTVEDFLTVFGEAKGISPKTPARAIRFGIDVATGQQKPKTPIEWMRGIAHGEAQRRKR